MSYQSDDLLADDLLADDLLADDFLADDLLANVLRRTRSALFLLLTLGLFSASAFAQQALTATLEGIVTDPNGAVIPSAKVAVKNTQTGQTRTSQADESGLYRLPLLQPGVYDLTVSAANFTDAKRSGITLTVGQKLNLDIALTIGGSNETINISAEAPIIETTRTNISSTVSDQQVATLPIRGRNFLDLVSLTPNVVSDPRQGDLSFGGQRGTFNSLQIDGADNNNSFFGQALGRTGSGRAPYQFSNDAVQEFQVNTNGFSAEFGRAAGGSINVVTKSGTNTWHGTAFEFFRDQSLNAKRPNFITARNGLVPVREPYHFNQFGGLIGGPIKKDKAFIFFNYDGQRNTRPVIMALGVAAPATPAAQAGLQRLLPLVNNYTLGFNQDVYLTKFDWQLDQVNRLSVRHNAQRFTGRNLENSGATSAQEHSGNSNVKTDTYTIQLNSAFSGNFLNEFRTQIARDNEPGFANSDNAEGNVLQGGVTALVFGRNSFSPRYTNESKYQFIDNVVYTTGKHSLKGGFDIILEEIENFFPGNFGGRYFFQATDGYAEFNNHFDQTNAGYRRVTRFQQSFAGDGTTGALTKPNFNDYGFFVQDDWRAKSNLTINAGLRYDVQVLSRPKTANPSATLAAAGLSTNTLNQDRNNFAPRLGMSWSPKEKLVVRANVGLFFGRTPAIALGTAHSNNGINVIGVTLNNVQLPFVYPARFPSLDAIRALGGTLAVPDIFIFDKNYQQPYTTQASLNLEYALTKTFAVGAAYLHVKGTNLSRTRDLNLGVPVVATINSTSGATGETPVPLSFLRHPGATAPARPIAGFGRISSFEGSADSSYNALTLTFRKRFTQNFSFDASYVWSKVLDNVPDQTSVVVGGGDDAKQAQQTFLLSDDKALGGADTPHRFVMNGLWKLNYFDSLSKPARAVLNDWELSGIVQVASGLPFTEFLGVDLNNDGNARTDRTPTRGRNTLRGERVETLDARLTKSFFVTEKVKLQLIGELFNVFNHTNVNSYQSTLYRTTGLNTATALLTRRTDFLDPRGVGLDSQRIGQLAVKLIF